MRPASGSPLAGELIRAGDVNLHEVRHHAYVVDDELKTEADDFKQRLRERYERERRAEVETGGAEAALDICSTFHLAEQFAAGYRHFDRPLIASIGSAVAAGVLRQQVRRYGDGRTVRGGARPVIAAPFADRFEHFGVGRQRHLFGKTPRLGV